MKRNLILLAFLCALLVGFGPDLAQAQTGIVSLDHITGMIGDKLDTLQPVRFIIRYNNNTTAKVDVANGWRVYSPDGAVWDSTKIDSIGPVSNAGTPDDPTDDFNIQFNNRFDIVFSMASFQGAGSPRIDTVGVLGAGTPAKLTKQLPVGYNDTALAVITYINGNEHDAGKHLCIDSSFWGVGGTWKWVGQGSLGELVDIFPEWKGIGGAAEVPGTGFCFQFVGGAPQLVLQVSPKTLDFTAVEGGANPAAKTFSVTEGAGGALPFTIAESIPWLAVTPGNGTTPVTENVNVTVGALTAGTYIDSIQVSATGASGSPQWVKVTLTVTAAPKTMVVTPDTLKFTAQQNGSIPTFQNFAVSVEGGGAISYTATETSARISLQNASGTTPANVRVDIATTNLAPGVYYDTVTFTSAQAANSPLKRIVQYTITAAPKVLVVVPPDLSFTAIEGGPNPASQNVLVTDSLAAVYAFTATKTATWLTITNTDLTTPGGFTVNVNMTGVTEGTYYDTITVAADGASNSPFKLPVTLVVGAPESKLLALTPDTLHFTGTVGGANPVVEYFRVTEAGGANIAYTATESVAWFSLTKTAGTTPDSVGVNVNLSGLTAGTHLDSIQISSAAANNSPIYEYVLLQLNQVSCPTLIASDTLFTTTVQAGMMLSWGDTLSLTSSGPSQIVWSAVSLPESLVVLPAGGTTPSGAVVLMYHNTWITPGTYSICFNVVGAAEGNAACSSSVHICLQVTVTGGTECADLHINDSTFNFTLPVGDGIQTDMLTAYRSDFKLSPIMISRPVDATWLWFVTMSGDTVSQFSGSTNDSVQVLVKAQGLTPGFYQAIGVVTTTDTTVCAPRAKYFVVALTIEGQPVVTGDSIMIGTGAAAPGGMATVPVNFINQCKLLAGYVPLVWNSAYATLDSISYVGSRIPAGSSVNDSIRTGHAVLRYEANNAAQEIPAGSGLWANLFFKINPATPLGTTVAVSVDTAGAMFTRNCGDSIEMVEPTAVKGGVVVDTISEAICGYVTDEEGKEIVGAHVQLWAHFPFGSPAATTTTNENGEFFFYGPTPMPYDIYAYADGYYPGLHQGMTSNQCGTIKLKKIEDITPTDKWVDYMCLGDHNTIADSIPLPVGTIIEVRTKAGLLVGHQMVSLPGHYDFLPVYRADTTPSPIPGAVTGDTLYFYVNGVLAQTDPDLVIYPNEYQDPQPSVCLNVNTNPQACQLHSGWNLVSWNVDTPTDDIETVLGPIMDCIDVVLGFEGGGLTFDPQLKDFSTLWSVDHLSGYWIKVKDGCSPTLSLNGIVVPANTPIPVYKGWNLVSYLPDVSLPPQTALASIMDKLILAYGEDMGIKIYVPSQPANNTLENMELCHGYWLKLTGNGDLVYPGGIDMAPVASSHENPRAYAARLAAASDVTTTIAWVNVFAKNLTLDGEKVKAGADIAAYSASGVKIGSFKMTQDGKFGFMPVYSDQGLSEAATGLKAGDKFTVRVNGTETDQQFTWTTSGDRIEIGRLTAKGTGNMPASYSLAQNYPNPFNPSTRISFSLPAKGQARIEIYNVLGRLVAVPFNGPAEAGTHEVVWDGRNSNGDAVASGIYFYRLTADKYTDTKKMMLLK